MSEHRRGTHAGMWSWARLAAGTWRTNRSTDSCGARWRHRSWRLGLNARRWVAQLAVGVLFAAGEVYGRFSRAWDLRRRSLKGCIGSTSALRGSISGDLLRRFNVGPHSARKRPSTASLFRDLDGGCGLVNGHSRCGKRSLAMRENEPDEGTLRALGFLH